jgi:hypothetical protein
MYFWHTKMYKYLTILCIGFVFTAGGQTKPAVPLAPANPKAPADTVKTVAPVSPSNNREVAKITGDPIFNIQFHYSYVFPDGDMVHQFGPFHNVGMGGLYKTQHNLVLAFDASYQFGNKIKDYSFLNELTNSSGIVMTSAGNPAVFSVDMRGFSAFVKAGYIIPTSWRNPNSGVLLLGGVGMYYQKMFISTTGTIPTLTEDMKKGYDNLRKGPALSQYVGYYYNSPNRFINFFIGVEIMEAFTQSVRKYNYATRKPDTGKYLDINISPRIGWMIPLYMKAKNLDNEYQYR